MLSSNIGSDGHIVIGDPWGDTWNQPLRGNFNQSIEVCCFVR